MDSPAKKFQSIFERGALYPVITPSLCIDDPLALLKKIADRVCIIQLRMKDGSDLDKIYLAKRFRKDFKGLLIIDDRPDIAVLSGADGFHLGQQDLSVKDAREIGHNLLIGASIHNLAEAKIAINSGADYVNIGPIFPTRTKFVRYTSLGIEKFKEISKDIAIPYSAMGGIKLDNADSLLNAGARMLAVVTAVTRSADPAKTVQQFEEKITAALR